MGEERDYVIKETPTRKRKHRPVIKGGDNECRQAQDRMATYESLSKLRENTLPELQVIGRFIKTLPDRCNTLYSNRFDLPLENAEKYKSSLEMQEKCKQKK
jgi:hypothetical protein